MAMKSKKFINEMQRKYFVRAHKGACNPTSSYLLSTAEVKIPTNKIVPMMIKENNVGMG